MPELPEPRRSRYINDFDMTESDADTLLAYKGVSDFFDNMMSLGADPREALGIVRGEILRNIGESGDEMIRISPEDVVKLLRMGAAGEIGANNIKKAVGIMMRGGMKEAGSLDEIIEANNMLIHDDPEKLSAVVRDALAANPAAVESYKNGESKVLGYFMGQCNKVLKGSVQPKTLQNEIISQITEFNT